MDNEKNKPAKRVSFAPEPQINYIYQDESTATKTSSFFSDAPMDITTELPDLKNLNLFAVEEFEESCSAKKEARRQSIAPGSTKRMSLNPLDCISFNYEPENVNNEESSFERSADFNNSNGSIINDLELEQESTISLEKSKGSNPFWSASIASKARPSLDGSFDNQGTINSSFGVDELVNTIDLRKIIPQKANENHDISEFLASQGIRFLDETVIDGMKRDTLSKSRNVIDPSLVVYYTFSLKERIDFLFNFSNFLIDKMKDLQQEIDSVKDTIDISSINKDNLKRIRNDSRNKSKIDWYSLRKIYEIQFNKKILENRNKVADMLELLKNDNKKTQDAIAIKTSSVDSLKHQIKELEKVVSKADKQSIKKTENFTEMIEERRKVLVSAKTELESKNQALEAQVNEESGIQKRIVKLQTEIGNLKKNLSIKNVGENQLEDLKKLTDRYVTIYGFNIIKSTIHSLAFEIGSISISLDYNSTGEVTRFSTQNTTDDPFMEFACSVINNLAVTKLNDFIRKCSELYILVQSIKKEISILKEKTRIECFYLNTSFYLRVFTSLGSDCFDLMLDKSFNLIFKDCVLENVKKAPGALSSNINSKLNN